MSTKKTLLIVDDSKNNIGILLELLSLEYSVIPALSGEKALQIISKKEIDLVLLDIMMPEMDGYEVCKRLKENEDTKEIPVLFITAKTDEESIEKAYSVGGIDYITKPFKKKEVLLRVSTQISLLEQKKMLKTMLIQQSKLAAMGEMMDSVAHQWKQPLSSICMNASLLRVKYDTKRLDNTAMNEFEEKISSQIKHMTSTLDEFSSFFRPSKEMKNFDVQKMLESVLLLVKDEFMKHKIKIDAQNEQSFELLGVENEFKHLILNIINNSKDAFLHKGISNPKIKIKLDSVLKTIEISDNAGGIDECLITDVFKANVSSKEPSKGSGIGLYMSAQIAQKHKGTLSVKNAKEGVMFIYAPAEESL